MGKERRELKFNTGNGDGTAPNSYTVKSTFSKVKVATAFNKEKRELRFPNN